MPQPFNNAVMTRDGAMLLTRAQAGEVKMKFTRIATGNGNYSADEKTFPVLQEQHELKSLKNSYPLSHVEIYSEHSVKITALITNKDLATGEILINEGYFINEMGLFAKPEDGDDDTEILYSITVTSGENGDFMPPYNGYNPAQITQEYFATVSNSAEVTINCTGALATAEYVEKLKHAICHYTKTATLPAGQSTVTFDITGMPEDGIATFVSSSPSLSYTGVSEDTSTKQLTVTFAPVQDTDVTVKLIVKDALE